MIAKTEILSCDCSKLLTYAAFYTSISMCSFQCSLFIQCWWCYLYLPYLVTIRKFTQHRQEISEKMNCNIYVVWLFIRQITCVHNGDGPGRSESVSHNNIIVSYSCRIQVHSLTYHVTSRVILFVFLQFCWCQYSSFICFRCFFFVHHSYPLQNNQLYLSVIIYLLQLWTYSNSCVQMHSLHPKFNMDSKPHTTMYNAGNDQTDEFRRGAWWTITWVSKMMKICFRCNNFKRIDIKIIAGGCCTIVIKFYITLIGSESKVIDRGQINIMIVNNCCALKRHCDNTICWEEW